MTVLSLPDAPPRAEQIFAALHLNVGIARHWVADQARSVGLPEADVEGLMLVVTEICTNCIVHSYGGERAGKTFTLRAWTLPDGLLISVCDEGRSIPAAALAPPDLSAPRTGGYGLLLSRALTDGWWVDLGRATGNEVRLMKLHRHGIAPRP